MPERLNYRPDVIRRLNSWESEDLRSGTGTPESQDRGENRASPGAGAGVASRFREGEPGNREANKPMSPKRISRGAGRAKGSLSSEIGFKQERGAERGAKKASQTKRMHLLQSEFKAK